MKKLRASANVVACGLVAAGMMSGRADAAILITEMHHAPDYMEIANTGVLAVDVSGWQLAILDDGLTNWSFVFDAGSILQPGEKFSISDSVQGNALVTGVNIPNSGNRGIYGFISDDLFNYVDFISITSSSGDNDKGGPPPANSPSFDGDLEWGFGDALVRLDPGIGVSSWGTAPLSVENDVNFSGTSSSTVTVPSGPMPTVPEPSGVVLLGIGAMGIALRRRR